MQLILTAVESEEDDQGCFQGGADGHAFHNGLSPEHYCSPAYQTPGYPAAHYHVGREFPPGDQGGCAPCRRIVHAFTWARSYGDRKEAEKASNLSRYQHRRSAVVEVVVFACSALLSQLLNVPAECKAYLRDNCV